jgi:hypothetical protein
MEAIFSIRNLTWNGVGKDNNKEGPRRTQLTYAVANCGLYRASFLYWPSFTVAHYYKTCFLNHAKVANTISLIH